MKLVKQIPPTDHNLSGALVAAGWRKIVEPANLAGSILASIPFMLLNGALSIFIATRFYNPLTNMVANQNLQVSIALADALAFIVGVFFMALVHELFHLLFIPRFATSDKIYWGINLAGGFVATTEQMTRTRFILISIMPMVLLSIILPVILGAWGLLSGPVLLLIVINAMGSSVDVLNILLVLFQAPTRSSVLSNGSETYFR